MSYVIAYAITFVAGLILMGYGNPNGWGSYLVGIATGVALASML